MKISFNLILSKRIINKLYKNFFAQPNQFLLNQLKGENLSLILNNLSPTDILILNEIFNKYFIFKHIEILPYTSLKQEITNSKPIYLYPVLH